MEILTAEFVLYLITVVAFCGCYIYLHENEIAKWANWYDDLTKSYLDLKTHSDWLDSSLKYSERKRAEAEKRCDKILEQARNWKRKFENKEWQVDILNQVIVRQESEKEELDEKNKELHKKIVNDSRPLQGTKKTWKIKKPDTISRSQIFRRKKECKK